jgi:hypothetical protein
LLEATIFVNAKKLERTDMRFPNKHVDEVDEWELDEGGEHGHEADDDEHVQGCGVPNLHNITLTTWQVTSHWEVTMQRQILL